MFCASKFAPLTSEKLNVARLFQDEFRRKVAKTIVVEANTTKTPEEPKIVQNGPTTPFSISDFTFTGTGEPRLCRDFEKSYIDTMFAPMPDTIPTPFETPMNDSQLAEMAEDWRNQPLAEIAVGLADVFVSIPGANPISHETVADDWRSQPAIMPEW